MAKCSGKWAAFEKMTQKARDKQKTEKIFTDALQEGIIDTPHQKAIYSPEKKRAMFRLAQKELVRQEIPKEGKTRGSTSSKSKALEIGERMISSIELDIPMNVRDFACRNCQRPDFQIGQTRVEIKSNRGEIVKGVDIFDTIDTLEKWLDSDALFIWFYDLSEWDYKAIDALEKMDDLPYIFTTCRQLAEWMYEYKGDLDRWFCITENAVNLTAIDGKRREYIDILSHRGYDWLTFRSTRELVEK